MKIAVLTTDNRDHHRTYRETKPLFGPAIESVLDGLFQIPDLEVHVVACTQQQMQAPEKLSENTWFHLLHVPKVGWLRTGYQGCVRAVRHKLQELQPDLVHGEGTERECAISAVFSGFPNVVTIHGNIAPVARSLGARIGSFWWWTARLEAFTLPRTDGVLCNSAYTESIVAPRARRTWRVPNAVRRAFLDRPLPSDSIPRRPIILNIGNVTPFKRQLDILDMAEEINRAGHAADFHFIGVTSPGDSYAARFLRRIRAVQTKGFAFHTPWLAVSELIDTLDRGAALIHAPEEESFGLVVAEALARNLKLFATRTGGVPDIADGVDGAELFASDCGLSLMQEQIERWLESGCPRPTGAAAEMRRRYHPDLIASEHMKVYQSLLSTGSI